ncbi:uncharacterized protein LOC130014533 [Mercurialis annua]|uniref:uncharacterized protein LOC130014533 n=1 Tax=Mercurialis annua TaxID=3986 RepID=UPI0021609192|nr:uncharacterized protein LOC130014533 [Mercurialis annua]
MEDPQPIYVQGYDPTGEMTYLFRKKLTMSDFKEGLIMVKNAVHFLDGYKNTDMWPSFVEGFPIRLYTRQYPVVAQLRYYEVKDRYSLNGKSFRDVAELNGFVQGMEIDCWAVTTHPIPLCLLLQEAD